MQAKPGMRMILYSALATDSRWTRETFTAGSKYKQGRRVCPSCRCTPQDERALRCLSS